MIFQWGAMATPVLMATLAAPFFAYVTFGDIKGSRRSLMIALTIGKFRLLLPYFFAWAQACTPHTRALVYED